MKSTLIYEGLMRKFPWKDYIGIKYKMYCAGNECVKVFCENIKSKTGGRDETGKHNIKSIRR